MVIHRISFHLVSCSTNLGTHKYYLGRWRSYLTKSDEHLVWVRFYIYYINIQLLDIIGAPNSHILWKLPTCSDSAEVSRTFDAVNLGRFWQGVRRGYSTTCRLIHTSWATEHSQFTNYLPQFYLDAENFWRWWLAQCFLRHLSETRQRLRTN